MNIRIFGRASGPNGSWPAGGIMVVGRDITQESAEHLVSSKQAEWVEVERVEEVETTEAPEAPENTAKATRKPRRRKR